MGSMLETLGLLDTAVGTAGTVADVANTGAGQTGLGLPGTLGLVLSGYGLAESIDDINANGATGDNVSSAVFSGTGVATGIASYSGGAAAAYAAPVLSAFAAGGTLGNAGNAYAKKKGYAGKRDGQNRTYSEMAADWGRWAKGVGGDGLLGDVMGVGATALGSIYGTAGTMLNAPAALIDGVTDMVTGPSPLEQLEGYVAGRKESDRWREAVRPTELQLIQRMHGQGVAVQQAHRK